MILNSAVRLLDAAAQQFPQRPAVSDMNRTLCYRDYRSLSRRVGMGLLLAQTHRRPVIVYLPKSTEALTVFMGAMYAGCPYVPVDAHIPLPRLEKIIASVGPGAIVTNEALAESLRGLVPGDVPVCLLSALTETEPDEAALEAATAAVADIDPIYIIYTSGSTGTPKGVTIPHRGILDYAVWVTETFAFDENTVMAGQAPFYFDNSTFDIYGSIKCGGHLVLIPDALVLYPAKLPEFLKEWRVTSIFWVPTVMINVANSGVLAEVPLPHLKNIAFAGEVMPNTQLNIWRRHLPGCTYANLYGPTEITDVCCCYILDRPFADSEALPIGRACENMRLLILNENNEEAAVGEQGELCILGSGVALGYWNAPELTEKAFVQNPLVREYPQRMYRSGDLACRNERGEILFLGRRDNQVKVKGNRIELGELETAAMCVPGVENACAVFDGEKQEIVLFLQSKQEFKLRKLNLELKKYIPAYMTPARVITMEKLPYTANEKIDRVTLKNSL